MRPEDIEKVSGAVNNCKDAAKNMADTMQDNLEGQLTILKSQLQENWRFLLATC